MVVKDLGLSTVSNNIGHYFLVSRRKEQSRNHRHDPNSMVNLKSLMVGQPDLWHNKRYGITYEGFLSKMFDLNQLSFQIQISI